MRCRSSVNASRSLTSKTGCPCRWFRNMTWRATASPFEICVPPRNVLSHGVAIRCSFREPGATRKRVKKRIIGCKAVPGDPGGRSSYAVSEKTTSPTRCDGVAKCVSSVRTSVIFVALMLRDMSSKISPLRCVASTSLLVGKCSAVSAAARRQHTAAPPSTARCAVVRRIAARSPSRSATGIPARWTRLTRTAVRPPVHRLAHLPRERRRRVGMRTRLRPGKHACRQSEVVLAAPPELVGEQLERLPLLPDDPRCPRTLDELERALERSQRPRAPPEPRPEPHRQEARRREQHRGTGEQQRDEQRRRDAIA